MKYPKNKKTIFIQFSDCDCRQINVHKGAKYVYWFIQPFEKPFKTEIGDIPIMLCGENIYNSVVEELTNFLIIKKVWQKEI